MTSTGPQTTIRHSVLVRVTHWIHSAAFLGLVISGAAILIAHPRLYWGETGGLGGPSLLDLPIPLILGHSGWGRYLHFLAAWICVLNGGAYVISGVANGHFRAGFSPGYGARQRMAYLAVVFALFPLMIVTGLAMSPAITSVIPEIVTVFGGQQSARTIHFFAAAALVIFLIFHVTMVTMAGFVSSLRGMITGSAPVLKERA